MSSNALRDQITGLFANIVNQTKDPKLIVVELQDLLLQLKKITVFDGLQLFIDIIESKEPFENNKIKEFLTIHLDDISMFPKVYDFIKSQNIVIQSSITLKDTEESSKESSTDDFLADITSSDESDQEEVSLADFLKADSSSGQKMEPFSKPAPQPASRGHAPQVTTNAPSSAPMPPPSPKYAPTQKFESKPAPPEKKESQRKKEKKVKVAKEQREGEKITQESFIEEPDSADKRNILIDYYSRMNINQIYDFTIKIDKNMFQTRKKQSDFLTGEQREQLIDEITVVEDIPIEVELNLPGCMVSPPIQYISPDAHSSTVTFYVTPYVKFSKRKADIVIGQKKLARKVIPLQVSVIDRRIMKIFSVLGVLIASVPSLWQYFFGVDMNSQIYYSTVTYLPMITNNAIMPLEVAIGGLVTLISLLSFKIYSSKRSTFTSQQPF